MTETRTVEAGTDGAARADGGRLEELYVRHARSMPISAGPSGELVAFGADGNELGRELISNAGPPASP